MCEFTEEIQQIEAFILMRMINADENNITVDGNKARKAEQNFGKIRRYIQSVNRAADKIDQLEAELKTYEAGNLPTSELISVNESMTIEIERLESENKRLASQIMDWENKEASICPEDFGFVEYIKYLTAELGNYHDAEKFVADPPHNQECCGCVPTLRKQIATLEAENRWIPVEERLPKDEYSILAYGNDGLGYKIVANTSYNLEFKEFRVLSLVTHWKPIVLPKEGE